MTEKHLTKLQDRIKGITSTKTPMISSFKITDNSVQAELRLYARWTIRFPADKIHQPKDLAGTYPQADPWIKWSELDRELDIVTDMGRADSYIAEPINERTKSGPARRAQARLVFELEAGNAFLAAYRAATTKTALKKARAAVERIQAAQKAVLPEMRAHNSAIMMSRRSAASAQRAADQAALTSGRFWEASRDALKDCFSPPFGKNHLADVSEQWRAALFVECESKGWKDHSGNWRHKLVSTGRAYLCGIDDNGDEWGHRCTLTPSVDQYGNAEVDNFTVEEAMGELFGISMQKLPSCQRQGDLLFCPAVIPEEESRLCNACGRPWEPGPHGVCSYCMTDYVSPITVPAVTLQRQHAPWAIRESHQIMCATSFERDDRGRYFRAMTEITVTHTSHASLTLPAGSYRLYTLNVEDAD